MEIQSQEDISKLEEDCYNGIMFLKGNDIREIRKAAQMNQREFGELLGVTDATVNRWEFDKRRPNYDMMERLYQLADRYLPKSARKQFVGVK